MNVRITLSSYFLFFIVLIQSYGQKFDLNFSHLSKEDGLPSGTANCTFQDSKGYIWFGTVDGLCRYDGNNFITYRHDPNDDTSLGGDVVNCIAEDSKGRIWVGSSGSGGSGGISVLDYETGKFTRINAGQPKAYRIPGNTITDLYIDEDDNVLILIAENGLVIYDQKSKTFSNYLSDPNDPSTLTTNIPNTIIKTSSGKFCISNSKTGMVELFDPKTKTFERVVFDKTSNTVKQRPIIEDRKGNLWVGGSRGVNVIHLGTRAKAYYSTENGLTSNIVSSLFEDDDGKIWIGVHGEGLNIFDPKSNSFAYFKNDPFNEKSLSTNSIQDIYQDRGGTIWVATYSGGINSYHPNREKFKSYRQQPGNPNSLNAKLILKLVDAEDGKIWIGTDGGGLNLFDPKTDQFVHYEHSPTNSNTPGSNVVRDVFVDREGIVWLGTYGGGLNAFDPKMETFTRYYHDPDDHTSIAKDNVWSINEDRNGKLIIGLLGKGIDVFDREKGTFEHYEQDTKDETTIIGKFVMFISEDSNENIWVGTNNGLNLFDISSGSFKRYRHYENDTTTLTGRGLNFMLEDKKGKLWFATNNGVSLYNSQKDNFIRPDINRKLPSLKVGGILEDEKDNLWISTKNGISKYDPASGEIENFGVADGLQGLEFSIGAALKSSAGQMYFGGSNGFSAFDPSKMVKSTEKVTAVFSNIRLFDQSINIGDTINGRVILKKDLTITEELTLTHKENVLAIEFSALDYISPEKNLYAYKLEGFDDAETMTSANNRKATYTNLDPGSYTFKIKASNHDGVFSDDNYATLIINVLPPWWKTWWFRTLFVIVTLFGIYFLASWRIRILNKQKHLLQEEVNKHTGKLREVIEILREKSEQISKSGYNLKRKSGVLAEDTQLQTESAKRIEGSVEVVIDHTKRNYENAIKTNKINESTVKDLEKIQEVNENNLKENQVISDKVHLLEEIFKQTNILSINAAIEAARAGGYGGGFSIIANEVKKLAERSRIASLEISGSAENGSAQTEEMEKLLLHFVPEMQKSVQLNKEISESSQQQTDSVHVMTQSLREFFKISSKNAETFKEIHMISSELDELAKYLNDQMKNIKL